MNPLRVFGHRQLARRGFTLLELLCALTLSIALMVAVSTSLLGYYRWRDAGERQIDFARTWLAVTQRVNDDLLSASRTWNESRKPDRPNGLAPVGDDSGILERVLQFDGEFSLTPVALFGDADHLALGTIVPAIASSPRSTEKNPLVQQVVVWSSAPIASWPIPSTNSAGFVVFGSLRGSSASTGIANQVSPTQMRSGTAINRGCVLIGKSLGLIECVNYPEDIQSIQFRYFDGKDWRPTWNSQLLQGLPVAVEATFICEDDVQPFRHVFHVPGTDPVRLAKSNSTLSMENERVGQIP